MSAVFQNPGDVRSKPSPDINLQMDERTEENIRNYADKTVAEISERIRLLELEWDLERALEMTAGTLALTGAALATRNRKWLLLSGVMTGFLVWHALKGWSPPVPLLRRAGARTRAELDREIYALKALRGDFQKGHKRRSRPEAQGSKVMEAVKAASRPLAAIRRANVPPNTPEEEMPPRLGTSAPGANDIPPVAGGI